MVSPDRVPERPQPADPRLLPVLVTVTYLASIVAASGFLSLFLDRDVIEYPDAGPLLGVVMVIAAGLVTWLGCLRAIRVASPGGLAVLTGIGCYAAVVITGAAGYSLVQGSITWLVVSGAHFALSPFTLAAAVLSVGAVVASWALARGGRTGHPTG